MLNFDLTPEQMEIREKVREFARREILPVAWYYDKQDEIPLEILKKAFDAGIMNTDIPEEYGGKGYGAVESALITEEIAAACPGLATSIFDNSLGMEPLFLSSNETAKKKYLPRIAKEFKLICFATSEPTPVPCGASSRSRRSSSSSPVSSSRAAVCCCCVSSLRSWSGGCWGERRFRACPGLRRGLKAATTFPNRTRPVSGK